MWLLDLIRRNNVYLWLDTTEHIFQLRLYSKLIHARCRFVISVFIFSSLKLYPYNFETIFYYQCTVRLLFDLVSKYLNCFRIYLWHALVIQTSCILAMKSYFYSHFIFILKLYFFSHFITWKFYSGSSPFRWYNKQIHITFRYKIHINGYR